MHEASITEALVEQVRGIVPAGAEIREVRIEVGELEHLDGDVLQAMWTAMTDETSFRGATLQIKRIPLRVRCRTCNREYAPEDTSILICPGCGVVRPEVLSGAGIMLRSIEIDELPDRTEAQ